MQSDKRLSSLFRRGVEPAFDELVRRYREPLVTFAGGIAGRDRAEDVVQESLVKAHRSLATDDVQEPRAWLYRVVRNTALNEIRDGAKHDHAELTDWGAGGTGDHPSTEAERREELAMLIAALAELPEAQRTALVGRELGGFSHDELADRLGVSAGATKQLIFRARTGLRNALGALIPIPLIAWMASNAPGTFLASGGGAAAAGAAGTAAGASGTGATGAAGAGGGILAGIAGGGAAKVAVVAAVAGGTVAAGVAVEENLPSDPGRERSAIVRTVDGGTPGTAAVVSGLEAATDGGGKGSNGSPKPDGSPSGRGSADQGGESGSGTGPETDTAPGRPGQDPIEGSEGPVDQGGPKGFDGFHGSGRGPDGKASGDSWSSPGKGRGPSGSSGFGGDRPSGGSSGESGGRGPWGGSGVSGGRGGSGSSGSGGGSGYGGGRPSVGSGSSHGGGRPESQGWTPPVSSAGPSQRPSAIGSGGGGRGPSAADRD